MWFVRPDTVQCRTESQIIQMFVAMYSLIIINEYIAVNVCMFCDYNRSYMDITFFN